MHEHAAWVLTLRLKTEIGSLAACVLWLIRGGARYELFASGNKVLFESVLYAAAPDFYPLILGGCISTHDILRCT